MPRELKIESVRGRMPVRYRKPVAMTVLGIVANLLIAGYSVWLLFTQLKASSPWLLKILPLVLLFVALDALIRHFTTLNSVIFTPECLWLSYLLLPSVPVEYDQISTMELKKVLTYQMILGFTDRQGKQRSIKSPASFPRMMEIMFNIADLSPQVRMNDELDKMISVIRRLRENKEQAAQ